MNAFDDNLSTGWAFGGQIQSAEITVSIEVATVAYFELLFYHDDGHIWEEFEVHIKHDGDWDRDMEMTINMPNVVKRCGSRFRVIKDQAGNPKKGAEYKIGFANGPVHRVDGIFFKVFDTFTAGAWAGNAVLSEVHVYGTKTGQFASTTKDYRGRYLMATQDNVLMVKDSVTSSPVAQFEMEPLAGGLFAWRNINKLYMECRSDGSLKFSKQTSDETGVKIAIEEQPDDLGLDDLDFDFDIVDPAKLTSDGKTNGETNLTSSLPIRTTPQTDSTKSCFPGLQQGTCNATQIVGWAISQHNEGGVFKQKTWEECLELCCKDPNCKSFDHNIDGERKCCISHQTMESVAQRYRNKNTGPKWSYSKISITPLPLKKPKRKKRVAFRTETGSYLSVDPQGQLTCNSVTLEENAIFDLVRPIETGDFAKFTNCRKLLLQAIS